MQRHSRNISFHFPWCHSVQCDSGASRLEFIGHTRRFNPSFHAGCVCPFHHFFSRKGHDFGQILILVTMREAFCREVIPRTTWRVFVVVLVSVRV